MVMKHMAVALCALVCVGTQSVAMAQAKKEAFTVERSWKLQRIGAPTVSRDGRTIIAPVTRFAMDEDKAYSDL